MAQNSVLFVDDETNVISAIRRGVIDEPYMAYYAYSAKEALNIMEKQAIDVIVTDMRMPEMDGLTLLKIVKDKYPRTVRVVLSGYTQLGQMLATINQGEIFKFITKPWANEEELLPAVRQAVDYYNLHAEREILRENLAKRNAAYQNILLAMEKKRAEEKLEFLHLKEISGWIFSLWRKYAMADEAGQAPGRMKDFTDIAEEVYLTYLSQLPTAIDTKDPDGMIAEIVAGCHDRVAIASLSPAAYKIRGNHKFLLMVFRLLAYHLADEQATLAFELAAEPLSPGKHNLVFTAKASGSDGAASAKCTLVVAILNKMGKPSGLSITIDQAGSRINGITINWQIEEG